MSRHPITVDLSNWGRFGDGAHDQNCERERVAASRYVLERFKRAQRTGADQADIMVGMLMAIVQIVYALNGNAPDDHAREAMHDALDAAWLQCRMMTDAPVSQ